MLILIMFIYSYILVCIFCDIFFIRIVNLNVYRVEVVVLMKEVDRELNIRECGKRF